MLLGTKNLMVLTAALFAAFTTNACNSSDSSPASSEADEANEDTQGTDEPAWVNSMFLTCAWDSIESNSTVGVACKTISKDPAFDPAAAGIRTQRWKVLDESGKSVNATKKENGITSTFIMTARDVAQLATEVSLSDGTFSKTLSVRFEALLEGLEKGGKLAACFNTDVGVADCFAALGMSLPNGDRTVGKPKFNPEESACKNTESLPSGTQCSITSDAMIGDYDQAREWFLEGNDLIASDGSLRSGDFCDQKGVKASTPKGSTSRKPRWFPFWKTGSRPCFMPFNPKGVSSPWSGKYLVYNNADSANGEPHCMFAIVAEPSIFGGRVHRMHIFKNPRTFADAASGAELTRDALESFAEHFACRE